MGRFILVEKLNNNFTKDVLILDVVFDNRSIQGPMFDDGLVITIAPKDWCDNWIANYNLIKSKENTINAVRAWWLWVTEMQNI
jgi:hypothetical protein